MDEMLSQSLSVLKSVVESESLRRELREIAAETGEALKRGNKILLCGNGGSAAEAQHIAAELVGRFKRERKGLPAISLTTDTSILTALANDYSFDGVFARQVEALGRDGDFLFLLTTSGNSKNCVLACETAKKRGIRTVAFTGSTGGKLKNMADRCFCVPSQVTAHIQESHLAVLHALCDRIEEEFSGR
ncbi:MAG TPA: D-sedoheptulose 7-phosphate isomerase [Candidatus Omnitrophota bacterium]|nr:D-sedoheptulose 7-phosphate isomerase [Candidatus Omnitrophota bacterium]